MILDIDSQISNTLRGPYKVRDVTGNKLIVNDKGKCGYNKKYKDKIIYCLNNDITIYVYFSYSRKGNYVDEIGIKI